MFSHVDHFLNLDTTLVMGLIIQAFLRPIRDIVRGNHLA